MTTMYMCMTDYDHEIGQAAGGTPMYASISDLRECRPCVEDCGIVEVHVSLVRIVQDRKPYKDWQWLDSNEVDTK